MKSETQHSLVACLLDSGVELLPVCGQESANATDGNPSATEIGTPHRAEEVRET
jgi:hypothetical protein